jgi:tyrosyl-tRNA synthetase
MAEGYPDQGVRTGSIRCRMSDDASVMDAGPLRSGAAEIVPEGGLEHKLGLGRPLRVKLGLDPTAPAVTLGWAVVLRKLRQFQDAGHTAVLIVGDFTARVGDPSGKSETRPRLSKEQVDGYAERLLAQFGKVVDMERAEIRRNSEWLDALGMEDVLGLTASTTVARMLERDDFAGRFSAGKPISLMEFLYPLLQGYDSVAVAADVELGGTDQLFNLLVGRDLQRARGMDPQIALTMPLLEGLDGVQKMSQSLGNYVGVDEPPEEMFGKLMSIPDHLIAKYELLCTDLGPGDHERVVAGLGDGSIHPNGEKRRMARAIVDLYHGSGAGAQAEARFDVVHRAHDVPDDVPEVPIPPDAIKDGTIWLPRLLTATGLAGSNGEARRLIEQGGVRIDGAVRSDPDAELTPAELAGAVIQVGRRKFRRIAE